MTLLVIFVINGLSGIFLRPSASISTWVAPWGVGCINPGGRGSILRPFFLAAPLPFLLLLLLFPSLLGGLSAIGALKSWGLLFLRLGFRFFDPWVFHGLALDTSFGYWQSTTLEAVLISVANIRTRPDGGLGFAVNGFFDYFFKGIELLAALLYFDLHWRSEAFSKVSNHCIFF